MYNNLDALDDAELKMVFNILSDFLNLVKTHKERKRLVGTGLIDPKNIDVADIHLGIAEMPSERSIPGNDSVSDLATPSAGQTPVKNTVGVSGCNNSRKIPFNKGNANNPNILHPNVKSFMKKMKMMMLAPANFFNLQANNLFEYELPPGIVTLNEAMTIIDLYKRGGRLVPSSVHKLLRLTYKILVKKRNISHVTIGEYERLIVVGDIHGEAKYQ